MVDYIKCELIGGGPPRHLNTFSKLFDVAVHYTYQYTLCIVAMIDCNHVHLVVLYKIIRTYHILFLLLFISPM